MFVLKPPLGHIRGANTNVHWLATSEPPPQRRPTVPADLVPLVKPVCKVRELRECVGDVKGMVKALSGVYHSISTFNNPETPLLPR